MATSRTASAKNKKVGMKDGAFGGFTIIEVVLVLAIAGLIFLMVFIALPQLQRAQRDTQRRNDLGKISTAITQYQTNNNGKLPTTSAKPAIPAENGVVKIDGNYTGCGTGATRNDACRLIKDYLNGSNAVENEFMDPDGYAYGITIQDSGATLPETLSYNDHMIYITPNTRCDGETITSTNVNPRDYTVVYKLEGSGIYCQDNG